MQASAYGTIGKKVKKETVFSVKLPVFSCFRFYLTFLIISINPEMFLKCSSDVCIL